MDLIKLIERGGLPVMVTLMVLSVLSLTVAFERLRFWFMVLSKEREIVGRILDAARRDWSIATEIARQAYEQPVGRFLYSALRLQNPDPELFRLALEAGAEEEIANMRRGEKIFEFVIATAPLLGLLGTVLGLMDTLGSITSFSQLGGKAADEAAGGIGRSLITTATGLVVALISLGFFRLFQGLVFNQAKIFRRAGNEIELLYRQKWQYENSDHYHKLQAQLLPEQLLQNDEASRD
ncbi:MAG: MotA/TolQ/ExbB proton channel family protein [Synechococcales bacterium]|nr:MotA/TolQ/ExbB proton channel family protein [Synechococcales bacterium]